MRVIIVYDVIGECGMRVCELERGNNVIVHGVCV